jgi:hypothetical protein
MAGGHEKPNEENGHKKHEKVTRSELRDSPRNPAALFWFFGGHRASQFFSDDSMSRTADLLRLAVIC